MPSAERHIPDDKPVRAELEVVEDGEIGACRKDLSGCICCSRGRMG
jgi:hypothetical protein